MDVLNYENKIELGIITSRPACRARISRFSKPVAWSSESFITVKKLFSNTVKVNSDKVLDEYVLIIKASET